MTLTIKGFYFISPLLVLETIPPPPPPPIPHLAFCGLAICPCVISVFGWLTDKSQGKIITLLVNNVVYTSVLTLCFGLTESLHQLLTVLHTSTLKTSAKLLGKYRELCNNYSALGIRLNNLSSSSTHFHNSVNSQILH